MARAVPLLVALAVLASAWLVPAARPSRLSALHAWELLELPVVRSPAVGPAVGGDRPENDGDPLWKVVLDSSAAHRTDDGIVLLMYGTFHKADMASEPRIEDTYAARQSIVRGLRQYARDSGDPAYQSLTIEGAELPVRQGSGGANFLVQLQGDVHSVEFTVDGERAPPVRVERIWNAPGRGAILPPLVAVALAVLLRRPLVALFVGVLCGAFLVRQTAGDGVFLGLGGGLVDVFAKYLWNEVTARPRIEIVAFVVFMLAMVGVMTRSGGIRGLMDAVAARARTVGRTQVATWIMGLVVFFDDYANTILVGSTMRPLTDRFRISREKLAYIVDSTAAPVAGLSIFSTWIAFEVSTFNVHLPAAGLTPGEGYAVFLRTIPFSFYCFLTIVFVGLLALSGRDFGPMLTAERRARRHGQLLRPGATPMVGERATAMDAAEGVPPRAWRAIVPLLTFIGVTLFEIARGGGAFDMPLAKLLTIEGATGVLYDGSGEWPLMVGSAAGFLVAIVGAFTAGLTSDVARASWTTLRGMAVAFGILYLAWMIAAVCADLGTASFLTALVGETIDPKLLPALLFVLAGVVAFATGSSWSTMGILLPLVVGLAYALGSNAGLAETGPESGRLLMVMSIGAVLSGAIFGDHCSPISDTTVLSSIASASDHIDHVRTQAPYALLVMFASVVFGYLPATYFELSPWLGLLIGAAFLALVVFVFGRRSDEPEAPTPA